VHGAAPPGRVVLTVGKEGARHLMGGDGSNANDPADADISDMSGRHAAARQTRNGREVEPRVAANGLFAQSDTSDG
jgi:uracil-DNA glycosylase